MKKEHILVIRFSALGDVAMAVPVVWAVAKQYPDIRITVLSKDFARTLFDDLAPNVNFMAADLKEEYHGVRGLNALYRRLVAKQFTKVADLHNVLRSDYLRMRFNLGRYRVEHIDKHRKQRRKLTAYKNKIKQQLPTSFENYAEVLLRIGYPVKLEFQSIFPPQGGNLRLLAEQIGEKKTFQKWIGIAPFAAHEGKVLPLQKMEQVIDKLGKVHPNARFFLFGAGGNERRILKKWCSTYPRCVCVSEVLNDLSEELILMSHLNVMVSMDSANSHLASLVNVPVVSIWGATHPYAGFMAWGQSEENAVQVQLPCRPCSIYGNKPCYRGDMDCMNRITPEMVIQRVEAVLDK